MLNTKFCGNRTAGSTEEDLRRIFTIYGRVGHLGHVTSVMLSDFYVDLQNSHIFIYSTKLQITGCNSF